MRLIACALGLALLTPGEKPQPAPDPVEDFVLEVLVDVMERGVPDYDYPKRGQVIILRETSSEGQDYLLSDRALPRDGKMKFKLMRWSSIDGQAFLTRQRIQFVTLGGIRMSDTEASVSVGGDYTTGVHDNSTVSLCCCHMIFHYRREAGHWVFNREEGGMCS